MNANDPVQQYLIVQWRRSLDTLLAMPASGGVSRDAFDPPITRHVRRTLARAVTRIGLLLTERRDDAPPSEATTR